MTDEQNRVKASTHGERRWAAAYGTAFAVLRDLDAVVAKRDRAEGQLGNAIGAVRDAIAKRDAAQAEVDRLEAKARRLRNAFETLRGDERQPADAEVSDLAEAETADPAAHADDPAEVALAVP